VRCIGILQISWLTAHNIIDQLVLLLMRLARVTTLAAVLIFALPGYPEPLEPGFLRFLRVTDPSSFSSHFPLALSDVKLVSNPGVTIG